MCYEYCIRMAIWGNPAHIHSYPNMRSKTMRGSVSVDNEDWKYLEKKTYEISLSPVILSEPSVQTRQL